MANLVRRVMDRMTGPVRRMAQVVMTRMPVRPSDALAVAVPGARRMPVTMPAMMVRSHVVMCGHWFGSRSGRGSRRSGARHWGSGGGLRGGDCGAGERGQGKSEQNVTNVHSGSSGKVS